MSTKRALIASALGEIGLADYLFDASPEDLQDALDRMNRMAAQWDGQGIRVGFNLGGGLDDESGVPDTCEEAFYTNLAPRIAPTFGKTISPETRMAAARAWNAMYVARRSMPQVPYSPRLPMGTGNKQGVLERQYFPATDEVPGLNDGPLEY